MSSAPAPLFGEFLLDRGYVRQDMLLSALLEQLAARPSVNEVLFKLGLLPAADQLRVLAHQARHQVDCRTACRALGLWRDPYEGALAKALAEQGLSLSELLLRKQALTLDTLTKALDEFVALALAARASAGVPTARDPLPPELRRLLLERLDDAPVDPPPGVGSDSAIPWLLTVLDTATFFGLQGAADLARELVDLAKSPGPDVGPGTRAEALSMGLGFLKQVAAAVAESGSEERFFAAADTAANLRVWRAQCARKAG